MNTPTFTRLSLPYLPVVLLWLFVYILISREYLQDNNVQFTETAISTYLYTIAALAYIGRKQITSIK